LEVTMSGSSGLVVTPEDVLTSDVRLNEPPIAPSATWSEIADVGTGFSAALGRALQTVATATDWATLSESITAMDGLYWRAIKRVYRYATYPNEDETTRERVDRGQAYWELLDDTAELGKGRTSTTWGVESSLNDIRDGPLAMLEAADEVPSVVISLSTAFWDYKREQRERWLAWVVEDLADVCDVRFVGSRLTVQRLVSDHREDLPASVRERAKQRCCASTHARARREETVATAERALDDFDPTNENYRGWWRMLWTVFETPAERRQQSKLHEDYRIDVGRTTVSKRISALEDAGLVEPTTIDGAKHVRLTPAGIVAVEEYLDEFGRPDDRESANSGVSPSGRSSVSAVGATGNTGEAGRHTETGPSTCGTGPERARETRANGVRGAERSADQSGADVSAPPTSSAGSVYTARAHGRGEGRPEDRPAAEATAATAGAGRDGDRTSPRSHWMDRYRHEATVSVASDGDFALCDRPATDRTTPGDQFVSYSDDRDEVVVSVEADKSVARLGVRLCEALLSEKLLLSALTTRKLDGTDVNLGGLETDNIYVLHKGRCLGYLKKGEANGKDYRRRLRQARDDLSKLAGQLSDDEGRFDNAVASALASESLGLAGTVISLFDLLDVDVHIEVEFSNYSKNHHSNRGAVTRYLSKLHRIASRLGHYSAQRTLYEPRDKKRSDALGAPNVDNSDPTGEAMASWILAGPGIDKIASSLRSALDDPPEDELQDDAENFAEFVVETDVVQGWRREAVVEVLSRMATFKNLHATRQVVAVLRALTGSVLDVARAMDRLQAEELDRELDLAELRFALVEGLPPGRILPETGDSTVSKAVHALLAADEPVSSAELARRAGGITTQSLRDNRDLLEAAGLVHVEEGDAGEANHWRLSVPFKSERHASLLGSASPRISMDAVTHDLFRFDEFSGTVSEAVGLMLEKLGREDEEVRTAVRDWQGGPPDLRPVVERWPDLRPWLDVVAALSGHGFRRTSDEETATVKHGTGGWSRVGGPPTGEEWARGLLRLTGTVGTRPPQRQTGLTEFPADGSSRVEG
jgi:DNA-binding MarR family transcriptional regulator